MKKQFFTFLIVLATITSFGQGKEMHPIDAEREKCHSIEDNQTTAGMKNCEYMMADLWDKQLNESYTALRKFLNSEQKEALKQSQQKWIAYRDMEFKFLGDYYNSMDGTMWNLIAAGRRTDIIRTRALELDQYMAGLE